MQQPANISLTASLPTDGHIEVWASAPRPSGGVGLVLSRLDGGSTAVVTRGAGVNRPVQCSTALPPPQQDNTASVFLTDTGVRVEVNGVTSECRTMVRGGGPTIRPGLRRVGVSDLRINDAQVPPPGPHGHLLWWTVGGLLGAALVWLEQKRGARPALVALTSSPLLLAGGLAWRDLGPWVEAFRVPWLDASHAALLVPILLTAGVKLSHHVAMNFGAPSPRQSKGVLGIALLGTGLLTLASSRGLPPGVNVVTMIGGALLLHWPLQQALRVLGSTASGAAVQWMMVCGAVVAGVFGWVGITHQIAVPFAFCAGMSWGLLLWANANAATIKGYNWVSLASVVLLAITGEATIRYTPIGVAWSGAGARTDQNDLYGWVDVANEEFALLEEGQHTEYPDKGFPVGFAAPDGRVRVVTMGGSTTGGAYQNDNLDAFYPARLQERLPERFSVINQGVGGWTTWHIRAYLQEQLDALRPDVLTLYVGHNDALTQTPLPYKDLYAAWKNQQQNNPLSVQLGRLRLYQGLRFFLVSLMPTSQRVAVPLNDAEDNLETIIDLVTSTGGQVVLASEGLSPDPGALQEYFAMMQQVADRHDGVWFVDVANQLHAQSGTPMFLDDCHLTPQGHQLVADALRDTLGNIMDISDADTPSSPLPR